MMTVKPLRGLRKFYGRFSLVILVAVSVFALHWCCPINSPHAWSDALTGLTERKGRFPIKDYSLESQQIAEEIGGHDEASASLTASSDEDAGHDNERLGAFTVSESFESTHEVEEEEAPSHELENDSNNVHLHEDDHEFREAESFDQAPAHDSGHSAHDHHHEAGASEESAEEDLREHEASTPTEESHDAEYSPVPCDRIQGAEDVVFVIKTGSTEAMEKLPVHFRSTLQCYPHQLIFSDFGEELDGHEIIGALDSIIDEVRLENDDFELWRRLNESGRSALDEHELSTFDPGDPTGGGGNFGNGGWRLDKFKNVPMVMKSIEKNPDAKWFIFSDADTYIVWSNLLKWLPQFDHTKPLYIGSGAMIDNQVFAHGGSGYILSNAAMHEVSELYRNEQEEWDRYAANHWAGDCVLSLALKKLGVDLTWGYPIVQGGDPVTMDWTEIGYDKRIWCYPAVSYHHLTPQTIEDMWHVEQNWTLTTGETMRHSDVFKRYILPQMIDPREDWNNLSEYEVEGVEVADVNGCRLICTGNSTCVQYAYDDGKCKTYDKPKLGSHSKTGAHSGWMYERIEAVVQSLEHCDEGDWIIE